MLQTLAITAALVLLGYSAWARRMLWRVAWDRTLTLVFIFQLVGLVLCIPAQTRYLGRVLHAVTAVWHLEDLAGHICFMSAVCAAIYAVTYRLTTNNTRLEEVMRPVEGSSAAVAAVMMAVITLSPNVRNSYAEDFMDVPCGPGLHLYWLVFCAQMIHLLVRLAQLLWILRTDPRSQMVCDLFLAGLIPGIGTMACRLADVYVPSLNIPDVTVWCLCSVAMGFAAAGGIHSWRQRVRRLTSADPWPVTPGF